MGNLDKKLHTVFKADLQPMSTKKHDITEQLKALFEGEDVMGLVQIVLKENPLKSHILESGRSEESRSFVVNWMDKPE